MWFYKIRTIEQNKLKNIARNRTQERYIRAEIYSHQITYYSTGNMQKTADFNTIPLKLIRILFFFQPLTFVPYVLFPLDRYQVIAGICNLIKNTSIGLTL